MNIEACARSRSTLGGSLKATKGEKEKVKSMRENNVFPSGMRERFFPFYRDDVASHRRENSSLQTKSSALLSVQH